jgi:alpha-2-macroglobulin
MRGLGLGSRLKSVVSFIAASVRFVGRAIGWVLSQFLGSLTWSSPPWARWLGGQSKSGVGYARQHPRQVLIAGLGIAAVAAAGVAGWRWYEAQPKPIEAKYTVTPPTRMAIEERDAKPEPLLVRFDISAATLATVNNAVTSGIELEPKIDGQWFWDDDKTLRFQPKNDWPIGQEHSVTFARKGFFADNVRVAKSSFQFSSAAFTAQITQGEFYQDPKDAQQKKIVATVNFTHPVDTAEFEKRVRLKFEGPDASKNSEPKFTVSYDKLRLNAYVHSATLPVPKDDSSVAILIDKGLVAARGSNRSAEPLTRNVLVPSLYSLRVAGISPTLVNNDKFEPEQVLVFETSQTVHEKDFAKNVTAYLLPVHHPDTKPEDRKSPHVWDSARVGPEILKVSEPVKLEPIAAEREHVQLHSFKYSAEVGRSLFVRVNKDFKAFGGYVMRDAVERTVRVPPYPKEVRMLHSGSLLAMSGEKKLSVMARDVPALRYEVGRLLPQQIQHLVSMSGGSFAKPEFFTEFDANNLTERFEEVVELQKLPAGKSQYHALDLGKYLDKAQDNKRGVFYLTVEGVSVSRDKKKTTPLGIKETRLLVVTDLGLLVKKSVDGGQDVFVQSIATGEPLTGVTVDVLGKNGLPVLSQPTDAEGRARFGNLKAFKREQQPVVYVARRAGDVSFMPMNRADRDLDLSRFDVGGVANTAQTDKLSAYLFSDRGIYRPGDEIRVGMIVKASDWTRKLAGIPLEAIVTDARGLVVKRDKIRLSAAGFEEIRHTTQETSPTGDYTINLHTVKFADNVAEPASLLGSVTVKVREFLPDRLKLTTRLSAESIEGWVAPEELKARVNLQNLFGTPAAERRITGALTLSPAYPAFAGYRDFTFYDPQRSKESFNEPLPELKTNDKGEAEWDLNLKRFTRATYRLLVSAQGFEAEGGRSVLAEAGVLVSSMPYLVGYKADGELGYITRGADRKVEFIAINPQAKKMAVGDLKLQHVERKFVSVLTKQPSGVFKYESVKKETVLTESPLALSATGNKVPLPSKEPGAYALVVRDAQGQELAKVEYNIAGAANLARAMDKNAELQIVLNKSDYAPGEEIELQIKAPYVGAGLVTIERERVHATRWFKSSTTSSVQKIKIPAGFEGNGYVSVAFVRDAASEEIYASPLSYGVVPFQVNLDQRKTKLSLTAPPLVKPGEILRMKVKADRPTRAVVFAIDEGILQVANYKSANPLGHFFQKRALDVKTAQILDLILPEFKLLMAQAAPGGDRAGAIGKNLNPFKRKRDKPVTFWSGLIDIDANEKEITYTVPDYFNGSLRVMMVAVSEDAIGVAEKSTTARGDFVLSPNVPTVVAPGDEFDVSVGIANNLAGSGASASVAAALTTSAHFEIVSEAKASVPIAEMREGVARYRVRAKEKLGSGTLTFSAGIGSKGAKFGEDISVRPAAPYMTSVIAGDFRDKSVEIPVTRSLYSEFRTFDAGVSHVPLSLAGGLAAYLGSFPYSCTEQLISMGMPAVVLASRPEFGTAKSQKEADSLANLLTTLRARQNAEGGFGMWAANAQVNEFASVYATLFLIEARERGQAVPADMLKNAENYLEQLAASDGKSLADERVRAFAIYVLTRQGRVTSNAAAALQARLEAVHAKTWKQDLAAAYLASAYQLMKQARTADSLMGSVKIVKPEELRYAAFYDSLIHNAQFVYLTARHFPDRMKRLPPEALPSMVRSIQLNAYNTLSASYAILALDAYASASVNTLNPKFTIAEVLKDGKANNLPLPTGLMPRVPLSDAAAKVRFGAEGDLTAYYLINQSGFDRALPTADIKNGLEVLREYVDLAGKPIGKVKLGEEIEVIVKMRALKEPLYDMAIVDLLPGGFEVVAEARTAPSATARNNANNANNANDGDGPAEGEGEGAGDHGGEGVRYKPPIGGPKSTFLPEYVDLREDRVVLYGTVDAEVKTFVYRIKATNTGNFVVPPTFAESMYDRTVQARSRGGRVEVIKP